MRVLVMGGTMFNGLALVRELRKHGHEVWIVNRGQTRAELPGGVERLVCDRTDHAAMRETLGGRDFDCIFDVSAYRLEDVELMSEIFRGRTGHYVFISSTVIYAASELLPISEDHPVDRSERQNEYGRNKLACEDHLFRLQREQGFPATVVAFSMVFGPNNILPDREQRMFARLLAGRPILIPGDGTTIAQVGHVEDQARALRMLMGQSQTFGRRYNLTGSDYFSAEGYVDTFAEVVGVPANKTFIPPDLMDDAFDGKLSLVPSRPNARVDVRSSGQMDSRAINQFMLSCLVQRIAPHLHRWNRNVVFGTGRLRRDVGWTAEYGFPAAVEQTYRWFRDTGRHESHAFDFGWEDELIRRVHERG
jgi:nucleoside-diphosphate-sugar epimerase